MSNLTSKIQSATRPSKVNDFAEFCESTAERTPWGWQVEATMSQVESWMTAFNMRRLRDRPELSWRGTPPWSVYFDLGDAPGKKLCVKKIQARSFDGRAWKLEVHIHGLTRPGGRGAILTEFVDPNQPVIVRWDKGD